MAKCFMYEMYGKAICYEFMERGVVRWTFYEDAGLDGTAEVANLRSMGYAIRALIRLESVYFREVWKTSETIEAIAASDDNHLDFVSKCKVSMVFGVEPLIHSISPEAKSQGLRVKSEVVSDQRSAVSGQRSAIRVRLPPRHSIREGEAPQPPEGGGRRREDIFGVWSIGAERSIG